MARRTDEHGVGHDKPFNPIPWALAIAIILIAMAAAIQMKDCNGKTHIDLSLSRASGGCEPAKEPSTPPASQASVVTAPERKPPDGYVYYEAASGAPTDYGALRLFASTGIEPAAPPLSDLRPGVILEATLQKRMRPRPTAVGSGSVVFSAQSCFSVAEGTVVKNATLPEGTTGGWLPVTNVPCSLS